MSEQPEEQRGRRQGLSRRQWIVGTMLGGSGIGSTLRCMPLLAQEAEIPAELAPIIARAKKVGLGGFTFKESKNQQYLGIGNAPAGFRDKALEICEKLAKVYRDYFETKGFRVGTPERPLIVIILRDQESYRAFVGESDAGAEVGGHYEVSANQLVVFDSQGNKDRGTAAPRINTFTLVHETIHQLTYNTGLLERGGDVPVAIAEGLATFCELWQHTNRQSTLGVKNSARLAVIAGSEGEAAWIPVERLLTDDDLFNEAETEQVAYAESWILVHYFLRTPAKLPKFRAYLEAIRQRTDPAHRLEDAQMNLGDLTRLDKELRQYRNKQVRS